MAASEVTQHGFVTYVTNGVKNGDQLVIGVLTAITVVFLTIVYLAMKRRGRNKGQRILLMGICDAGKSLMFSKLVYNTFKQTVTSTKPNSGSVKLPEKNKSVPLTDLPGHERLRNQMMDEHRELARGVIFVVDSSTIQKEIKEVAEYLYTILTDQAISQNAPPLLVACNKQDMTLCKGSNVIRSMLEKEMNTLRVTRSAALQGLDNTANNNTYLGKRNKDFEFADLQPLKVEFVECSARGKTEASDGDLKTVVDWMTRVA